MAETNHRERFYEQAFEGVDRQREAILSADYSASRKEVLDLAETLHACAYALEARVAVEDAARRGGQEIDGDVVPVKVRLGFGMLLLKLNDVMLDLSALKIGELGKEPSAAAIEGTA